MHGMSLSTASDPISKYSACIWRNEKNIKKWLSLRRSNHKEKTMEKDLWNFHYSFMKTFAILLCGV